MKEYIPTLMKIYQDMVKRNEESERLYKNWKASNTMKNSWEYTNSNNILNAIEEEYIFDESDIHSPCAIITTIIVGILIVIFYLGLVNLTCNF